ncbi:MAG: hypothetical protein A2939_00745 [Parcubacteria group bacterium RIFCSPLOWO2_01_FULL_48_18]|nr:MAG: hypothetical protein A3J67_01540 [Parcubacteria group bacterium RIFCSPHIGHO2_02_FULL_48_10b]OHB22004.1 MAG: hypothetical protein A2939_00745 [Parcubacteria group bacterium RIFCSPLOWO2_01_FULL_48_18]
MKTKYLLRTRIGKNMVAEFLPPSRESGKAIILCDGLPSMPHKKTLVNVLAGRGFWVFHLRYRGTWESGGEFLRKSPAKDVIDAVAFLKKGRITDLYNGKIMRFRPKQIFVFGSSFGGATAICASVDKRIDAVVAISPVADFCEIRGQDPRWLKEFVRVAFWGAYRSSALGWRKLISGTLMNPQAIIHKLDKNKIFIIHSIDDEIVRYGPVKRFARMLGCRLWSLKTQGHMSLNEISRQKRLWREIAVFLRR